MINSLNVRFPNLPILSVIRLLGPTRYRLDEIERNQLIKQWLDKLLVRFDWNNDIANQCKREILEFVETLMNVCEWNGIHKAWLFCGTNQEFMQSWPTMMKLWQWILIILASTVICECGFSKHNWVKSDRKSRLKLETSDALMRVSLCSLPMETMDWTRIFDTWK